MADIRIKVACLKKKYGTSNPFKLAASMGIMVLYEDLGSMHGYYNKPFRIKQIHINQNLPEHLQAYTCAHELGHAVYHPDSNTPFLRGSTMLSVNKMEMEANKFAVELLISDEDLERYREYSLEQISRIYGYHEALIRLRLKQ